MCEICINNCYHTKIRIRCLDTGRVISVFRFKAGLICRFIKEREVFKVEADGKILKPYGSIISTKKG